MTSENGVRFTSKTDDKSEFQDAGSDALRRIVDVFFTGEWYGVLRPRIDYSNRSCKSIGSAEAVNLQSYVLM